VAQEAQRAQDTGQSVHHPDAQSIDELAQASIGNTSMNPFDNRDLNWNIQDISGNEHICNPGLDNTALTTAFTTTSPASTTSGHLYSAEIAPLRWLNLLKRDATAFNDYQSEPCYSGPEHDNSADQHSSIDQMNLAPAGMSETYLGQSEPYNIKGQLELSDSESMSLRHFVEHISTWIDLTDRNASFASYVPTMALKNRGLMLAILALSSRHQSLLMPQVNSPRHDRTVAVRYHSETLQYLQIVMKIPEYLKSDELLATVLLISKYEMIDGFESGWESHLKGV
jgi:hypothetical protein